MHDEGAQTILFLSAPNHEDLCCVYCCINTSEKHDPSAKSNYDFQILKCRQLIFTLNEVLASPILENQSIIQVIISRQFYATGKLQALIFKLNMQISNSEQYLTNSIYESCLRYTLIAHLAPQWNQIDNYLIQGRNFLIATTPLNAVKLELGVNDKSVFIVLWPMRLQLHPAKLEDLDVPPLMSQEFFTQPNAAIYDLTIGAQFIHVLPSLKKARILTVSRQIPNSCPYTTYKDLKRHWKNSYGYRLPELDSDIIYYTLVFHPMFPTKYTYPSFCIASDRPTVLARVDHTHVLRSFLADLARKMPNVCGQPFAVSSQLGYAVPKTQHPSNHRDSQHTPLMPKGLVAIHPSFLAPTQLPPSQVDMFATPRPATQWSCFNSLAAQHSSNALSRASVQVQHNIPGSSQQQDPTRNRLAQHNIPGSSQQQDPTRNRLTQHNIPGSSQQQGPPRNRLAQHNIPGSSQQQDSPRNRLTQHNIPGSSQQQDPPRNRLAQHNIPGSSQQKDPPRNRLTQHNMTGSSQQQDPTHITFAQHSTLFCASQQQDPPRSKYVPIFAVPPITGSQQHSKPGGVTKPRVPAFKSALPTDIGPRTPAFKSALPTDIGPRTPAFKSTLPTDIGPRTPAFMSALPTDIGPRTPAFMSALPTDIGPRTPVFMSALPTDIRPRTPAFMSALPTDIGPRTPAFMSALPTDIRPRTPAFMSALPTDIRPRTPAFMSALPTDIGPRTPAFMSALPTDIRPRTPAFMSALPTDIGPRTPAFMSTLPTDIGPRSPAVKSALPADIGPTPMVPDSTTPSPGHPPFCPRFSAGGAKTPGFIMMEKCLRPAFQMTKASSTKKSFDSPRLPQSQGINGSQKRAVNSPSAAGDELKKKPRSKPQVQANVDVVALAQESRLASVNSATLISWLQSKGVKGITRGKKTDLVDKVTNYLNSQPQTG